jgi:hypothetical protein
MASWAQVVSATPGLTWDGRPYAGRQIGQVSTRPSPFIQLRHAATRGPVVIVNISRHGCHALLVTTNGVQVVDLPDITHDQAFEQANTLLTILNRASHPEQSLFDRDRDRHALLDILDWLWDTVTGPVLASLGHTSPPISETAWPRIWWCPTGSLTMFPLHAAGHHPRNHRPDNPVSTDTVPARVISSYTPSLTALMRAHIAPCTAPEPRAAVDLRLGGRWESGMIVGRVFCDSST